MLKLTSFKTGGQRPRTGRWNVMKEFISYVLPQPNRQPSVVNLLHTLSLSNPVYTIRWQTGLTTVLNEQHCSINRLSNRVVQPAWQRVWQPVVSCIQTFYTVVKPVWQPVWHQVVLCKQGFTLITTHTYIYISLQTSVYILRCSDICQRMARYASNR